MLQAYHSRVRDSRRRTPDEFSRWIAPRDLAAAFLLRLGDDAREVLEAALNAPRADPSPKVFLQLALFFFDTDRKRTQERLDALMMDSNPPTRAGSASAPRVRRHEADPCGRAAGARQNVVVEQRN